MLKTHGERSLRIRELELLDQLRNMQGYVVTAAAPAADSSGLHLGTGCAAGPRHDVYQNAEVLEEERARIEETAKLRDEDYQLAYAVDILRGLNAVAAPMASANAALAVAALVASSALAAPSSSCRALACF